jgi:hypothetical protein
MRRWTSRKFILALAAELGALAVLIWPRHADAITGVVESLAALLVALLSALGYLTVEGAVEKARAERDRGMRESRPGE